ncbi:heme peroxidase [Xylariaceae sp. FL0255]|nr:heme peroxidase [Xylariaceae sp. FL0255]
MRSLLLPLTILSGGTSAMFYYPNPRIATLEHILVDNWGAYASNFSAAITPCTNYVTEIGDPALNSGRTTAAQWLRVAFHDFVTADVQAGTGGIDASIGFETGRAENIGSAFNDSFTFWQPFVNEYVPMADLIALGTVMSVNLCGGKYIPFRPGRVDALAADPTTGVPEPDTSLDETLAEFSRAGFNQVDAIGLTACGHTLGSVHHTGFPTVADNSTLSATNTAGGINFDSTRAVFDPLVVHEYIDGTGQRGGTLVTSFNVSSQSEFRLYESDGNATMQSLYDQGDGFIDTCVNLLGRMLDTVPEGVTLLEAIQPMLIKPINVTWDVSEDNQLMLSGRIRVLNGETAQNNIHINIEFTNGYKESLVAESGSGSSAFGSTTLATFLINRAKIAGSLSFTVLVSGAKKATFDIQDGIFIIPSMTTATGVETSVTVAVAKSLNISALSAQVAVPMLQPLTLGPKINTLDVELESAEELLSVLGDYELWKGSIDISQPTGAVNVRVISGGQTLDSLLVNSGVAGW